MVWKWRGSSFPAFSFATMAAPTGITEDEIVRLMSEGMSFTEGTSHFACVCQHLCFTPLFCRFEVACNTEEKCEGVGCSR
jgi:hypothetical protein